MGAAGGTGSRKKLRLLDRFGTEGGVGTQNPGWLGGGIKVPWDGVVGGGLDDAGQRSGIPSRREADYADLTTAPVGGCLIVEFPAGALSVRSPRFSQVRITFFGGYLPKSARKGIRS